jgi:hypothetical protein
MRFITASHTQNLAFDLANKSRQVITSDKYKKFFPEVELDSTQAAKGYYDQNEKQLGNNIQRPENQVTHSNNGK